MENRVKFKSSASLAQQCYEQLQNDIIEGILKPGEKLKVEPIKARFSIGQSPIREALSRLVALGLVSSTDNKGFRVASLSESDIRDVYDTFTRIENLALELSIARGDDQWEANIVAALHQLSIIENKKEAIAYETWAIRNYNFHVALISGCNSSSLLELRKSIYLKFDRYCRMAYNVTRHSLAINHADHKELAETILRRDTKKAQEIMHQHINGSLENIIKTLKQNQLI